MLLEQSRLGVWKSENAVVVFEFKGTSLRLPIELEIVPGKTDHGTSDGDVLESILRLYTRNQEIVLSANIYMGKKQILLGFDATSVHLEKFADFAKQIPGLTISGEADINGEASIQFMPFKISSASACCQFRNTKIACKNLMLETSRNTRKEQCPFEIEINQMVGKDWKIAGTAKNCKFKKRKPDAQGKGRRHGGNSNFIVLNGFVPNTQRAKAGI